MPKRHRYAVVGLSVGLVLLSLAVAIVGLRLIVSTSVFGYVLTLVGFLSLLLVPVVAARLSGERQGPVS